MKRVNPRNYDKEYYLTDCYGFKEYLNSEGMVLNSTLQNVVKHIGNVKNKSILDIGCGRGELVLWFANNGACCVDGIDYSKDAIELANNIKMKQKRYIQQKIKFWVMDAKCVVDIKNNYDLIVMTEVLEHLYTEEQIIILNNIKKLLKKDGVIYIHTSPSKTFLDYFYRYWSVPMSRIILKIWNYFTKSNYPGIIDYRNVRTKSHKIMHVNEPRYFSLKKLFKYNRF